MDTNNDKHISIRGSKPRPPFLLELEKLPDKDNVRMSHAEILAIVHILHLFEKYPCVRGWEQDVKTLHGFLDRVQEEGF